MPNHVCSLRCFFFDLHFLAPYKPDEGMDLSVTTSNCLICLVEHVDVMHPRAMVLRTGAIQYLQKWRGDAVRGPGVSELSLVLEINDLFFTELPFIHNNVIMSVLSPFRINFIQTYS